MTVFKTRLLAGVALCVALIGPGIALAETLSGTVTYRERIALPPDAQITVQLQDVSRADAPAQVLGEAVIAPKGQVPVPFALDYDADALQPGHSYALQARITRGDRLLFTNSTLHEVFGAEPDATDILVERVKRRGEPAGADFDADIAPPKNRWLAEDIGGKGVLDRVQSVLEYTVDGTITLAVSGSGGCNDMTGKVTILDSVSMRFSPLAVTRRACLPAVAEQEARFFAALAATRKSQLDATGDKLLLLDAQGQPLMRLTRD